MLFFCSFSNAVRLLVGIRGGQGEKGKIKKQPDEKDWAKDY